MSARVTLADRLADYFKARQGQWIDGMEIAAVAGSYAWRSRCSDLRRQPYGMVIENRQRRVVLASGDVTVVSEYRYVPDRPEPAPAAGQLSMFA